MAVRVMGSRAVAMTYGQRALVIGATNPTLFVGTAENTAHRSRPWARLMLTAQLFEAVFLGSKEEADCALAFARKRHETVSGVLPATAGPHAGEQYAATDPYLMFMTMAYTFDSAQVMYDLLVRRMSASECEGLWRDFVRWAELFGMPRSAAPGSYREFRDYFDDYLESDDLYLTDEARGIGRFIAGDRPGVKVRLPMRPTQFVFSRIVRGSLPTRVRKMYGLQWTVADEISYRSAVQAARVLHTRAPRVVPKPLKPILRGPTTPLYKALELAERRALRNGRADMPGVGAIG